MRSIASSIALAIAVAIACLRTAAYAQEANSGLELQSTVSGMAAAPLQTTFDGAWR